MAERIEAQPPADLPDELDHALRAFWQGDTGALQKLIDPGGKGPHLGPLLDAVRCEARVRISGLPNPPAIAGYRLLREVDHGGMGVVYEAEQAVPRRRVALKVLGLLPTNEHRRRFRREIETQARLRHPFIATVYEAGQTDDGRQFFTMELVAGAPLHAYVQSYDLSLRERLELFSKICDGVAYAHARGVIHRDLKPANILVDNAGDPRIVDFGLARWTGAETTGTLTAAEAGKVFGTLAYMSPEQAYGQTATAASDVYSLGVILYELLTGQNPQGRGSWRTICEQRPPRPSTLLSSLRGDLDTVILKALEKDPAWRYPSVAELRADVRRYLAGEPIRDAGFWQVPRKWLARHRVGVTVASAAVLLALLGTSATLWWRVKSLERERAAGWANARWTSLWAMEALTSGDTTHTRADWVYEQYPKLPDARLAHAQAVFRVPGGEGRHGAIQALEDWWNEDERGSWVYAAALAEIYRVAGDAVRAQALNAVATREMPDTAEAWYLRSFGAQDIRTALAWAREAVARRDADVLTWRWFTCLCSLTEDHLGVLRGSSVLIEMGAPELNLWRLRRADALAALGRLSEALDGYETVRLAQDELASPAMLQRAHALRRAGDYAGAVESYTAMIEASAEHSRRHSAAPTRRTVFGPTAPPGFALWAYYHRATTRWMMGDVAGAIDDLQQVRPAMGRSFFGDARLYVILCDEGRTREAAEVLSHATADVPADGAWLRMIFDCLGGKVTPTALIDHALEREEPEHQCEAYYYAGEALRLSGQAEDAARTCFEKCLQTGVAYDRQRPYQPMSEYDLAAWRLGQMGRADTE